MKRSIVLVLLLSLFVTPSFAQGNLDEEPMKASIIYKNSLLGLLGRKAKLGRVQKLPNVDYPAGLKEAKFFFIELNEDETYSNTGMMGPKYDKINSKVTGTLKKKLGDRFDFFTNNYLNENNEYFREKGYKYRVLVYSKWKKYKGGEVKQFFHVAIQDLETEKIYTEIKYWAYFNKFLKEFVEKCS